MTETVRVYMDIKLERLFVWLAVGIITLIAFEAIAVGTAMPTVVDKLDGRNLYAVAMGIPLTGQLITTALAGVWCDARTSQSCLYSGIAIMSVGLTLCTFSPTMVLFVVGRTIQGLGAGLCVVPIYAIIGAYVRPTRQGSLFAAMSAAWVLPSMVGPVVAGWMVTAVNWRWVFGLVPLLFAVVFPVLVRTLNRLPARTERKPLNGLKTSFLPAVFTGIAVAVLQVLSGTSPEDFTAITYAAIGLTAFLTFVFVRPLLPRGVYVARRGLASTVLVRGLTNGTFIGTEAFLPLLLQEIHGWSPTSAGFILTVGSVTWAIGAWIQGRIIDPQRRQRIAYAATLLQCGGIALIVPGAFPGVYPWLIVAGWTVAGLGTGLIYPTMSVHGLAMTSQDQQGATSSAIQLADTLGSAFCVAVAGIMYAMVLPAQSAAFACTIGLMATLFSAAIVVIHRIMPHPGSTEEANLAAATRALEAVRGTS